MRIVPDHRILGMVTYPLDEILLATLVSFVCGADDWDGVEEVGSGALGWLREFLPFESGVASAQILRRWSGVFRLGLRRYARFRARSSASDRFIQYAALLPVTRYLQ